MYLKAYFALHMRKSERRKNLCRELLTLTLEEEAMECSKLVCPRKQKREKSREKR